MCKLIIWDEAPVVNRFGVEALDRMIRDIMQLKDPLCASKPFGGKTVIFGGDFHKILLVISKGGSRQNIVGATINTFYLWEEIKVIRLTKNMILMNIPENCEREKIKIFAKWVTNIGDGNIGCCTDYRADVEILDDIMLEYGDDLIEAIVESTYLKFLGVMDDPMYLQNMAILAPTLDVVDSINEYMIGMNGNALSTYLSSDSASKSDANVDILADIHIPEFLISLKCSGVPNHKLNIKVSTPTMFLRNIDHSRGLCNRTRLLITKLGERMLQAKLLTGNEAGNIVLIEAFVDTYRY